MRIHGVLQGNVRASKSLAVGATGRITGDLEYFQLSIQEGASINGRCVRINPEEARQPAAKPQAKPQPKTA